MTQNGRTDNGTYSETDLIETVDEDGQVHIFERISELEIEGQEYALLIYKGNELGEGVDEPEEGYDENVVVMRITHENGEEVFENIEDEAEFERVVAYIESMEGDDEDEVVIDISDFVGDVEIEDEENN